MAYRQKILAIHSGALGDVILFCRLLNLLDGEVTLVAGGEKARLMAELGAVSDFLDFDALPMHEIFTDNSSNGLLVKKIGGFDTLISCFVEGDRQAELRLISMCEAANASFLPIRPVENFCGHLVHLWADMLGIYGLSSNGRHPQTQRSGVWGCTPKHSVLEGGTKFPAWEISKNMRAEAKKALVNCGVRPDEDYLAVHPGAGSVKKCWPLENFLQVARNFAQAVFILGPTELERWPQQVIAKTRDNFPVLETPSLSVLAGMLAGAKAFIGNDSGPSHLAAAVGAPTVAIFTTTSVEHFTPLGPKVKILQARQSTDVFIQQVLKEMKSFL